jgi:hypothetical protein
MSISHSTPHTRTDLQEQSQRQLNVLGLHESKNGLAAETEDLLHLLRPHVILHNRKIAYMTIKTNMVAEEQSEV